MGNRNMHLLGAIKMTSAPIFSFLRLFVLTPESGIPYSPLFIHVQEESCQTHDRYQVSARGRRQGVNLPVVSCGPLKKRVFLRPDEPVTQG